MGTNAEPLSTVGSSVDLSTVTSEPEIVETPTTVEGETTVDQTTEPEVGADGKPKPGTVEGEQKEDGRVIPKWMRAMKEADPEGYKQAKSAFFNLKERESVHPTVQIAREEHELVESLGGREGADKLREDASFFSDAANQFLKGDPAFVKDLWEEDPIAAALHVQPMLEQFKTKDLDGYKSTIARIWANDFKGVGFAPALGNLLEAIKSGNKDVAAAITNSIKEWHDSIIGVAERAEDPRVKTLLAERSKQHETRQQTEHQEFLKGYRTETINDVAEEAFKTFDSQFRGRTVDKEDRTDLVREALALANKSVEADKDFITQRDKHLERGDSISARRLTKARFARELPEAVKRIARRYGMVSGKGSQVPNQPKPNQQQQQASKVAQGYVAVNFRPTQEQIDYSRTPRDMILGKKAILRDGRKVDWSAFAAKAASA